MWGGVGFSESRERERNVLIISGGAKWVGMGRKWAGRGARVGGASSSRRRAPSGLPKAPPMSAARRPCLWLPPHDVRRLPPAGGCTYTCALDGRPTRRFEALCAQAVPPAVPCGS